MWKHTENESLMNILLKKLVDQVMESSDDDEDEDY